MPSAARGNDSWNRLDWVERSDVFNVAPSRPARTLRQNLRIVEASAVDELRETVFEDVSFQYVVGDIDHASQPAKWLVWLAQYHLELKQWDIYDIATVIGIVLACVGFVMALFPPLRSGGILFPIGAALMAFAAYGARRRDAYTD
jgi:hypothetical protein